jgi:fibronectin-binding autotransporter adhesin
VAPSHLPIGKKSRSLRAAFLGLTLLAPFPAIAGTTWDGGGANASWGTANNWNPDGLPLFNGTETITIGTAFTSGSTLTLDSNRNVGSLLINTTTAFTITTGTGGSLGIYSGNITRQDVTGTESTHTISANVVLGDPTGAAAYSGTWSIDGANSLDVSGVISEAGGSRGITKTGAATLTLSGANTYTGATTINAGTVTLDYTTVGSKLADTSILALGGGMLNLANGASAHNEVVASTTINSGGSSVTRTSGTSVLRMNVITRNAGGTINFGAASIADTDTSNTNGILGGWATVAGADWAVSATSAANTAITALASYIDFGTSSATTNQIIASSGLTTTGGTYAANSLKIAPTGSGILILNGPSGKKLTITSGGILFVGSSDYTISATVGGNTLLGASNGELIVQQFSTGNLTISAIIADNGTSGLIKAGTGALTLSGANSYTGGTIINGGTLTAAASSGSALGSTSSVTVNSGGTVLLGASDQINNSATMTLAGGTFAKGDFAEGTAGSFGVGALTLVANGSHIDFGTGTVGVLSFASFNPGSNTLNIDNWTGTLNTVGNAGTDRLVFDSDQSLNLAGFSFTGYAPGAVEFALGGGYYEIVPLTPVPEPATYISGILVLGALGWHQRGRLCSLLRR